MGKKLYEIDITGLAYVLAEDSRAAKIIARDVIRDDSDACSIGIGAEPVTAEYEIDERWEGCYPFGGDGELTVDELLLKLKANR